jgi:hypothetical protein
MASFKLQKAKLILKYMINKLQLAKATLKRILMLTRTVKRIPAQEPFPEAENSDGARVEEAASVR